MMKEAIRVFAVKRTRDGNAIGLTGPGCEERFERSDLRDLVRKCLGYTGPTELGEHDHWDWYLHPLTKGKRQLEWSDCHDPQDVLAGVSALAFEVASSRQGTVWDPAMTCARHGGSGELLAFSTQLGLSVGDTRVFVNARSREVVTYDGKTEVGRRPHVDGETVKGVWSDGREAVLSVEALPHPCDAPEKLLQGLETVCRVARRRRGRVASQRLGAV